MQLQHVCMAGAALCALAAGLIDQHLQLYRAPDAPAAAFWIVPFRLRAALYEPDARRWVARAWLCLGGMALFGAAALLVP